VVSDRVQKARGYKYPGVVVSRFLTLSGQVRYVVEALHPDFKGMLHIFSDEQLEPQPTDATTPHGWADRRDPHRNHCRRPCGARRLCDAWRCRASEKPRGRLFHLAGPKALKRLEAVRGPPESYSVAILRLAEEAAVAT
jgi:hypothetical protein